MLNAGEAELVYELPLTIRLIDKTEYLEELRYQRGRRVEVTKCPNLDDDDKYPRQDWEGEFEFLDRPTTGRKSTRSRPPRHRIDQVERDFQRYKTGWLRRRGEEEKKRAEDRIRAGSLPDKTAPKRQRGDWKKKENKGV